MYLPNLAFCILGIYCLLYASQCVKKMNKTAHVVNIAGEKITQTLTGTV